MQLDTLSDALSTRVQVFGPAKIPTLVRYSRFEFILRKLTIRFLLNTLVSQAQTHMEPSKQDLHLE